MVACSPRRNRGNILSNEMLWALQKRTQHKAPTFYVTRHRFWCMLFPISTIRLVITRVIVVISVRVFANVWGSREQTGIVNFLQLYLCVILLFCVGILGKDATQTNLPVVKRWRTVIILAARLSVILLCEWGSVIYYVCEWVLFYYYCVLFYCFVLESLEKTQLKQICK